MKTIKFQAYVTLKQRGVPRRIASNFWYLTIFEKTQIQYKFSGPLLKQNCCQTNQIYRCKNVSCIVLFALCNLRL